VSAVFWDTKAPAFALRDYGLASQARETDGDGAPIFTPEFPKADPYLFGKGRVAWSLNQIVKKVGTPRRRGPKHQAQRAVSGIKRRQPSRCATTAWQARRERRTATARHPYQKPFPVSSFQFPVSSFQFPVSSFQFPVSGVSVAPSTPLFCEGMV
jgi:hypothetical protein